jgi:hypothetical protein
VPRGRRASALSAGGAELPKNVAIGVLVVICVFISGFAW